MHPDEFFKEVTLRISSSLDVGEAMQMTFDYLTTFIPLDRIILGYFDDDRSAIYFVADVSAESGITRWNESEPFVKLDQDSSDYMLNVFQNEGRLVEIRNFPEDHPDEPEILRVAFKEIEHDSTINILLSIKNEVVGGLFLVARGLNRYTSEHAALMETVKEPIAIAMSNARRYHELLRYQKILAADHRALSQDMERFRGTQVIGADFGLRHVMEMVRQVATLNSPVLLTGETGTGKEVIANAIHLSSGRRNAPMIRVQCGAIPDSLLDSELFGHEKGAFTGAIDTKRGRFERAHGGTLFLDEIGELTLDAQVKLLRVLQEKEIERLGGTRTIHVDVRVIAATHRNLAEMVKNGEFREDLWFRLNVFPMTIPPLRQRKEDIASLAQHFIKTRSREMGLSQVPSLSRDTLMRMQAYHWPGNVRELQNVIERALILSRGDSLTVPMLDFRSPDHPSSPTSTESTEPFVPLDRAMIHHICTALERCHGKINGPDGAARLLGINPNTLRSRMKKFKISRYPQIGKP